MTADTHSIAACLNVDENTIRRLQARGYLLRFDLTRLEVRQRLYEAHLGYWLYERQGVKTLPCRQEYSHFADDSTFE